MSTLLTIMDEFGAQVDWRRRSVPEFVDIQYSLDPHVHLREPKDGRLGMTLRECAFAHTAIIDIGNNPTVEVTSLALLEERAAVVEAHQPLGSKLRVYYAPLIGKGGDPNLMTDIRTQRPEQRKAVAVKVFWEGVSNAKTSISDVEQIRSPIEQSTLGEGHPTLITWHAECVYSMAGKWVPVKDREYVCVTEYVERALYFNKSAIHVIRHISDRRTIEWAKRMRALGFNVHLEVCVQYLLQTTDSILMADDGSHMVLQCDCIYWPRPKDEEDRLAFIQLILAGYDWVHIGADYAMHLDDMTQASGVKINSEGKAVGGLNFRPRDSKAIVIDVCVGAGREHLISPLMSGNAAAAYGIVMPIGTERYVRKDSVIPTHTIGTRPDGSAVKAKCFLHGFTTHWESETPRFAA